MWTIKDFTVREVELDFRSAGLSLCRDRALYADGLEIMNAIGCVDFDDDPIQVLVCRSCGTTQCENGGWIGCRSFGEGAVLIPAFKELAEGDDERAVYAPPSFMARGAALVEADVLAQARELVPAFSEAAARQPFTTREAALVVQWEAPARALGGDLGSLRLRQGVLVAVESGDLATERARFEALLGRALLCDGPAKRIEHGLRPATFYLDVRSFPPWSPMAETSAGEVVLQLGPGIGIAVP